MVLFTSVHGLAIHR
jgi:hypothetical protein